MSSRDKSSWGKKNKNHTQRRGSFFKENFKRWQSATSAAFSSPFLRTSIPGAPLHGNASRRHPKWGSRAPRMAQVTGWVWHHRGGTLQWHKHTRAAPIPPGATDAVLGITWRYQEEQSRTLINSINSSSNEAELHKSSSNSAQRENPAGNGTSSKEPGDSHPSTIPSVQHHSSAFSCTKLSENSSTSQLKSLQLFRKIWKF